MKLIRWVVGRIVLLINWLTWPKAGKRDSALQQQVEQQLKHYALYQFAACPFCVKVRREMRRLNLPIELRDAKNDQQHRGDLQTQGGRIKVPLPANRACRRQQRVVVRVKRHHRLASASVSARSVCCRER